MSDALHRIGRDVVGPAFTFHVERVIELSDQRRLDRLWFLARDAHLLLEIYQKIDALHRRPPPQVAYLQVSRRAALGPRDRLMRHLDGVGFLRTAEDGVVDVGWTGTIQDRLTEVCGRPLRGFYLGLLPARPVDGTRKQGTLYDFRRPRSLLERAPLQLVHLFEQAGRSHDGSVVGYDQMGRPSLLVNPAEQAGWAALARLQEGIREHAAEFAHQVLTLRTAPLATRLAPIQRRLKRLIFLPTRAELDALAELTCGDGPLVRSGGSFADAPWKPGHLRRAAGPLACVAFSAWEAWKLR
jgi:hypothetical protein